MHLHRPPRWRRPLKKHPLPIRLNRSGRNTSRHQPGCRALAWFAMRHQITTHTDRAAFPLLAPEIRPGASWIAVHRPPELKYRPWFDRRAMSAHPRRLQPCRGRNADGSIHDGQRGASPNPANVWLSGAIETLQNVRSAWPVLLAAASYAVAPNKRRHRDLFMGLPNQ